ncbi:2Fe-2S iron-sulfur cluster-binding protein [Pseudoprimorskyibacter insulae]|uniref:Ferredoxin-6 n=1 Tax=Pseudoprimorskyibacter insulae TaxID=1695997 RepID=A0A2R8AY64_9RHOB|nr:2Fe-2S iron-sulfur cluster-binding protein [Pseudoprimorskyibacter insulae]SPF80938.1 Ferredoxin-6 [Pseudoprimorskyibacter insulae]
MVNVTYVAASGSRQTVAGNVGESVMQTALNSGVDGIIGECGGSMACATCHCFVDEAWTDKTGTRMDGEEDLLDCAAVEMQDTSRLSCQIRLTPDLDGLVVHLPESQT